MQTQAKIDIDAMEKKVLTLVKTNDRDTKESLNKFEQRLTALEVRSTTSPPASSVGAPSTHSAPQQPSMPSGIFEPCKLIVKGSYGHNLMDIDMASRDQALAWFAQMCKNLGQLMQFVDAALTKAGIETNENHMRLEFLLKIPSARTAELIRKRIFTVLHYARLRSAVSYQIKGQYPRVLTEASPEEAPLRKIFAVGYAALEAVYKAPTKDIRISSSHPPSFKWRRSM